jgi:hypothetical protein
MSRRDWSPEEEEKLRILYFDGYNDDEIAERLERSACSVKTRRSILCLNRREGDVPVQGSKTRRWKKSWTPEEDAKVLELFDSGSDTKTIASELGRTYYAAESRMLMLVKRRMQEAVEETAR